MTAWVGVLGTHGWPDIPEQAWWHRASPFARFLAQQGLQPARPETPFVWSGDLQGVPFFGAGKDWEAGAQALRYYLEDLPYESRNVIAHSHGGQVALLCAVDLPLRSLVMVGTPVRKDIERRIAPVAARQIGRCLHLSDAKWDWMGLGGALFDRRLSFRRTFRVPGIVCEQVHGIGHSGILRDERLFPLWLEHGWINALRVEKV